MNKVLIVDDDPVILKLYRDGLSKHGLTVESTPDGLEAVKTLHSNKPDLVVLDLMMPKFSGVDVLKFIRGDKQLAALPVIVLSNAYMGDLARDAVALGVQKALLKVRCTPDGMAGLIKDILSGKTMIEDPAQWPAVTSEQPPPAPPKSLLQPPKPAAAPVEAPPPSSEPEAKVAQAKAQSDFREHAPATRAELGKLLGSLLQASTEVQREIRLQNLYRKVHFVTAAAGMAGFHHISQMTSAFEALLFDLMGKPGTLSPSIRQTMAAATDFLGDLFERARQAVPQPQTPVRVLVVDDDQISNRLVVSALRNAHIEAQSTEEPRVALSWLKERHYDVVLLDIELPQISGFELCKQVRALPGYAAIPVIYVANHDDFENRAQSVLSGGDDLIAKPVVPLELAVKVVMHLLRK